MLSHAKKLIEKKRKSLARRIRRAKAKEIARADFLSKKISKKVKTVLDKFPDIVKTIENFMLGQMPWILTFDGNRQVKKATLERIRRHLEESYHH